MTNKHQRKLDHIEHCSDERARFRSHAGLFDDFQFVHNALPELAMNEVQTATRLLDSNLAAPIMVTGMTGGPESAGEINRAIAQVCDSLGLAFGVGSQRLLTRTPEDVDTFAVRGVAPDVVLFGNVGVNQARDLGVAKVRHLMDVIEADYMAIHLNPAMELAQPGSDADSNFKHGYDTIGRLVDALDGRVLVKECGCGIGPQQVQRLAAIGVRAIDVSGSGGTSWVKVEALRAEGQLKALGETFSEWGIPTLAATALASRVTDVHTVASGGVDDGLKVAKAIASGAQVAGLARPVLQAFLRDGADGARAYLETIIAGWRVAMALTASKEPADLRQRPRLVTGRLRDWLAMDADGQR